MPNEDELEAYAAEQRLGAQGSWGEPAYMDPYMMHDPYMMYDPYMMHDPYMMYDPYMDPYMTHYV